MEWSNLRLDFVAWLDFYHKISQMEDPPPDHIIEDDEALDGFLRTRRLKREGEERKARLTAAKPSAGGKTTREKIL